MARHEITPLVEQIQTPLTSCEAFELFKDRPYSFFLDSGMGKSNLGRYSFIGSDPFLVFKSKGSRIEIVQGPTKFRLEGNPFDCLKGLISQYRLRRLPDFPPFLGGAVGYFGYDLCHFVEKLPSSSIDDLNLPDCYLCFYDAVIIFDHLTEKVFISSTGLPENNEAMMRGRQKARLAELSKRLSRVGKGIEPKDVHFQRGDVEISSNFLKQSYIEATKLAKEYIASGDIFQVNLSQRFCAPQFSPPFELYKRLRKITPAPFASFLNFDGVVIVSASPERFLRMSGSWVQTRPIKGTRPRGEDPHKDCRLRQELLASEKDRAELIMIVDLERNDLGRVCEYGTVSVPRLITLETYSTVFHLVGTVEGRLNQGRGHIDCLRACFPGGSITGAPKVRAMEIIDELEPTTRGIYTGSIGYLGFNQETDLNIVIRTMVLCGGKVYFQVGGGIVADSDPQAEYDETLHKAKALMEALTIREEVGVYGRVCLA